MDKAWLPCEMKSSKIRGRENEKKKANVLPIRLHFICLGFMCKAASVEYYLTEEYKKWIKHANTE